MDPIIAQWFLSQQPKPELSMHIGTHRTNVSRMQVIEC